MPFVNRLLIILAMNFILFFLPLVVLSPAQPAASPRLAAQNPVQAIELAQKGIDNADFALFKQAVDLDSLIREACDQALTALVEFDQAKALDMKAPFLTLLFSNFALEKPTQRLLLSELIASELRTYVATGINGGYFAGKSGGKDQWNKAGKGFALLPGLPFGKKRISAVETLKQTENEALVSVLVEDGERGKFPLTLKVSRQNEEWRIVEVHDVRSLIREQLQRLH